MTDRTQPTENHIDCSAVNAAAFEYLDGEMPPDQCATLDAHMGRCPPCRDFVERERSFLRTLRAKMAGERCPDVVRDRIREAMRQRRHLQSNE